MAAASSWFTTEIQQMMYGFGDNKRPLPETAILVEEIVHQQMVAMIEQASQVAAKRGEKTIGIEDILFLLRKDKAKLKRILRFYEVRDLKNVIKSALESGPDLDMNKSLTAVSVQEKQAFDRKVRWKNRQICYDFLSSIDQTGELLSLFDDEEVDTVKHERMVRAAVRSQGMDPQQYLEFCQARQANFSRRYKNQRFRDWLQMNLSPEIILSATALEIFSYLAYETVAQIVDLALLVKQDKRAQPKDPASKNRPALCVNYAELHASSLYNKLEASDTVPQSPPYDNTGSSHISTCGNATNLQLLPTTTSNKLSKKKRKRSDPPTTVEMSWDATILPSDVREVMRRYYTDIGPFASQMKINHQCSTWYKTVAS